MGQGVGLGPGLEPGLALGLGLGMGHQARRKWQPLGRGGRRAGWAAHATAAQAAARRWALLRWRVAILLLWQSAQLDGKVFG